MAREADLLLIENVRIFDGSSEVVEAGHVLVDGARIVKVGGGTMEPPEGARVIDGGGRVLMPGLVDAHYHLIGAGNTAEELLNGNRGLIYANALTEARRTLMRGFTTIRDVGGDVAGLAAAIDAGKMPGPRVYPSQAAISQTAGHGDFGLGDEPPTVLGGRPSRIEQIGFMRVADGPDRVLAAVREQLKQGASQIKLMAGGGVASLHDPLDTLQFTPEELRAAVQAAEDWGTYVAVHVYNTAGVHRAIEAGVRSIEHGHLVDEGTVKLMADQGVWLSTQPFDAHDMNFPDPRQRAKNQEVAAGTARLLGWAHQYGANVAFGTDIILNPPANDRQIQMLTRLGDHMSALDALRIATSGNAELLRLSGERDPYRQAPLGVIAEGAWADLLIVDGDPTQDLGALTDHQTAIAVIIKNGEIIKNLTHPPNQNHATA